MSRSAIDATRFTATSPHAYAKPTSINRAAVSSSTNSVSSTSRPSSPNARFNPHARIPPSPIDPKKGNAPPTETPLEKVARLRRARLEQLAAQTTGWDRIVVRGRKWADTAHKITVFGIVGFSIVTVSITGFALTDMILHNRRKRSAFYAEQHAVYGQRLLEAIEMEKAGLPLDEDQTLVLNRERARVMAEEAAKERTWWKTIQGLFIGGLKGDEDGGGGEGGNGSEVMVAVPSEGEILQKLGIDQSKILERATALADKGAGAKNTELNNDNSREDGIREGGSKILQAVAEKRREGERVTEAAGVEGGPLDRMAEGAVQAVEEKIQAAEEKVGSSSGGSWTSWWSGK